MLSSGFFCYFIFCFWRISEAVFVFGWKLIFMLKFVITPTIYILYTYYSKLKINNRWILINENFKYLQKEYYKFFCSSDLILHRNKLLGLEFSSSDLWVWAHLIWMQQNSLTFFFSSLIGTYLESLLLYHHRQIILL